jgi:hypothetical protein
MAPEPEGSSPRSQERGLCPFLSVLSVIILDSLNYNNTQHTQIWTINIQ